jgi:lipopolysaccharide transport protein LptA
LRHLLLLPLVAGGALIAGVAVPQDLTTSREPIVVHSVFSNINDAANTADFKVIVVSQGDKRLTAERASATGVGFTDSRWTFEGRVMITLEPRGTLWADQAILEFRGGELAQVTAIGSPAHFEQQRTDSRGVQRGQADQITYAAQQDTVRLSGHAELTGGHGVLITAPVFVYQIRDDSLQIDSESERRLVHMTITP